MPPSFSYILEELLHEQESMPDKEAYYASILDSILDTDRAEAFITAMAELIQRLSVDRLHVIGDVKGRTALIIDDIVDTAGTLVKTVDALMEGGARAVYAACTHPVLSGPAIQRLCDSQLKELVVTNSIPLSSEAKSCDRIQVLSVAPLLARAIRSIHEEASVSTLFV